MTKSEQVGELVAALAKAQGSIVNPQKNKVVNVRTKAGGSYEFRYADLTAIIDSIKKPLSDNGLAYTQVMVQAEEGKFRLETTLLHSSGQFISSTVPLIVEDGGNQQFGSALTFMRRYSLVALIGINADDDDDANTADGNDAKIQDRKPKPPAANPVPPKAEPAANNGAKTFVGTDPHAITVPMLADNSDSDWIAWGRAFSIAVKDAKSADEANVWRALNIAPLKTLNEKAPKVYKRLGDALSGVFVDGMLP